MLDNLINTTFSECKILEKIGQGGMGAAYKAHHLGLDKTVCVKLLSPDLAKEERNIEFFLREARSAAKLEHPNIVQIYHFGQEKGIYFIVMSYIEGTNLQDMVQKNGPLAADKATDIIIGVLNGLEHAHSKTIIHRDIKPSNILVTNDFIPKIVDFGLARSINEEKQLTITGEMIGTAYFMSPEQGLANKVDHRADIYSTGATYFYILTGKYPFEGKNSIEVIHKHISEPLPSIITINQEVPLWVTKIVEKMMRKKPEDRYQTARDVIEDITKARSAVAGHTLTGEIIFDIPGISERIKETETSQEQQATIKAAIPKHPEVQQPKPEIKKETKTKPRQYVISKLPKFIMHFVLITLSMAGFLIAGCLPQGNTQTLTGLLLSPIMSNILKSTLIILFSTGFLIWAQIIKPVRPHASYFVFLILLMLFSYISGAIVHIPGNPDAADKASFIFRTAVLNLFSKDVLIIYSIFLYLLGSKFMFQKQTAVKILGALISVFSIYLAYLFFNNPLMQGYNKLWLYGALFFALGGFIAALVSKEAKDAFNPSLLFLVSSVLVIIYVSIPQVTQITVQKTLEDADRVAKLRADAYAKALRIHKQKLASHIPVYDEHGLPIEPKLDTSAVEAIQPTHPRILKEQSTKIFLSEQKTKIKNAFQKQGGALLTTMLIFLFLNLILFERILQHNKIIKESL